LSIFAIGGELGLGNGGRLRTDASELEDGIGAGHDAKRVHALGEGHGGISGATGGFKGCALSGAAFGTVGHSL
jgi:hypothetical protein